jgi:hypothetical protein
VVVNLINNASIAEGAPGKPGLQPLNITSFPDSGKWYSWHQGQAWLSDRGNYTRLPAAPGPIDVLALTQSLVVQSDPGLKVNMTAELDLLALQGIFRLPSPATNATQSNSPNTGSPGRNASTSTPPVTLTFSNLTLFNLPPGPYSTWPLGMSTIMMWSVDMDR